MTGNAAVERAVRSTAPRIGLLPALSRGVRNRTPLTIGDEEAAAIKRGDTDREIKAGVVRPIAGDTGRAVSNAGAGEGEGTVAKPRVVGSAARAGTGATEVEEATVVQLVKATAGGATTVGVTVDGCDRTTDDLTNLLGTV